MKQLPGKFILARKVAVEGAFGDPRGLAMSRMVFR